ncbi:hypothetical protein [Glaciihabitans sp. UYNi722]|uniref:hypothetical protein n=1 Tax=Glaciihabitans sp. UYNi722 TaxID=3156344 RepID=UPI0033986E0B
MATIKNASGSYDATADRVEEYSNLSLQQVDEAHRINGTTGPALHVENELDAFGREQEPLWKAEGILQSRPALIAHAGLKVQAESAEHLSRRHRRLVKRAQRRLERTVAALSPFVRRKQGQKGWFMVRTGLLLLGDVAGQAGAQIYYGEIPELALIQALAAGVAVVTAGLVGAEIKDLRMASKRKIERANLTKEQEPFAHLFDGTDDGKHIVKALVYTGVTVGVLISIGIFALRSTIDGPLSGLVYGALAAGIAAASFISSYIVTDEIADAIDTAEKDYERTIKRQTTLAASAPLKAALEKIAEDESIRGEHDVRGQAALLTYEGLKHRVLRRNPGVAGHGPAVEPEPVVGRRAREDGGGA